MEMSGNALVVNEYGLSSWEPAKESAMKKLGQWINLFQNTLPLNSQGLPTQCIDPQVMAETGLVNDIKELMDNTPEGLIKPISFIEGYATIGGYPFWERLEGEMPEYFKLFQTYRNMKEQEGMRSLHQTHSITKTSLKVINALKDIYHWIERAKAYDCYTEQMRSNEKARNISKMENTHQNAAKTLFAELYDMMKNPEYLCTLSGKEAIELLKAAAQLERLSLGLNPDKPNGAGVNGTNEDNKFNINITNDLRGTSEASINRDANGHEIDNNKSSEILRILEMAGALKSKQPTIVEIDPMEDVDVSTASTIEDSNGTDVEGSDNKSGAEAPYRYINTESPADIQSQPLVIVGGGTNGKSNVTPIR